METQSLPVLWQPLLKNGIPAICKDIVTKQDSLWQIERHSIVSNLCTRSWTIYRAIRTRYVAEETFTSWRTLFQLSNGVINNDRILTYSQEMLVLRYLQQITNIIFESCKVCSQDDLVVVLPTTSVLTEPASALQHGSVFGSLFKKLGPEKRKSCETVKNRNSKKLFTSSSKQSVLH